MEPIYDAIIPLPDGPGEIQIYLKSLSVLVTDCRLESRPVDSGFDWLSVNPPSLPSLEGKVFTVQLCQKFEYRLNCVDNAPGRGVQFFYSHLP